MSSGEGGLSSWHRYHAHAHAGSEERRALGLKMGAGVWCGQVKFELGVGEIKRLILEAFKEATGLVRPSHKHKEGEENEDQGAHKKHKVDQPQAQAQPTA